MDKVVSFNRDGEYLLERASRNRGEGRFLEALKLCRRAVELEPGNVAGWMDVAQTLCEMGRYEQSNRVLALMLSVPGAPSDCYLGMGCNFMGLGDMPAAFGAMINLISLDPAALERDDVVQILRQVVRLNVDGGFDVRFNRRVAAVSERARELLAAGETSRALAAAEKLRALAPEDVDAARLYARALACSGDTKAAVEVIEKALLSDDAGIRTVDDAVKIYRLAGADGKAKDMAALLAARPHPDEEELLICLDAACEVLDDENVALFAAKALRQSPFDTRLFHVCAVNRARLGRPREQAVSFWTRAYSIDPDDPVLRYYLRLAEAGALDSRMSYEFDLPAPERTRLDALLNAALLYTDEELNAAFKQNAELRCACQWAARSTRRRASVALALLARSDDPWASRELSENRAEVYRRSFREIKCSRAASVSMVGAGCASLPPALERAVKLASQEAGELLEGANVAYLYRALKPLLGDSRAVRRADYREWAAVLAYAALNKLGAETTIEDMAERLSCPLRRVKRRLREYLARGGNQ